MPADRHVRLPPSRLLCVLVVTLSLLAGTAWAQGDSRPPIDEVEGHIATFEVVERIDTDEIGATLRVLVEVDGIESPSLVVVGPNGTLLRESDGDGTFTDLPQGDYLIAATAHRMRMVAGTVAVEDGEDIGVVLRLFNLPVYYADVSDTPILGIFTLDVADNDDDERGALELRASPSGTMAVVGSDGYVTTFAGEAETQVLESLEPGMYVVAMTLEEHGLALTRVVVGAGERVTVAVDLEAVEP